MVENPSWRLFLFHGRALCNARWRGAYAMAFQSCRLHIACVTIANAAIFIIPLLLLFDIVDISHTRTSHVERYNITVIVVFLRIINSRSFKTNVKRKHARNSKSAISRRSYRDGSRNRFPPSLAIELILSVCRRAYEKPIKPEGLKLTDAASIFRISITFTRMNGIKWTAVHRRDRRSNGSHATPAAPRRGAGFFADCFYDSLDVTVTRSGLCK